MNKRSMDGKLAGILLFLILIGFACEPFEGQTVHDNPSYLSSYIKSGNYTINPKMILTLLDMGETNVFIPIQATQSPNAPLLPPGSFRWTQSDYLKIADALSQFVWKETLDLEDWSVYYISFRRECQNPLGGFDSFDITYYKTIEAGWQKVYTARYIEIYPLASEVRWGGDTNFSISNGWGGINLTQFKVAADEALQVVEENGGKEARSRVENDCLILIRAPNHGNDDSWDVYYYPGIYFEMLIDPYSGKYRIPTPTQ